MSTSDNKALVERFIRDVFQDLKADFRIANGKLAEHWHHYDESGMVRQLKGNEEPEAG